MTVTETGSAARLIADLIPRFDAGDLGAWLARSGYHARYNIGPGQDHWVVRPRDGRPILAHATWGMPGRDRLVINARAETLGERPMFRNAFARGRCLVVADGFFEWDRHGRQPQPWWFRDAAGRGLLFAAVLTEHRAPETEDRFAIVTVPASADVPFHPRMPAIIDPSNYEQWLFGSAANASPLLAPAPPGSLTAEPVSRRVNSMEHDDPACVEPVSLDPPPTNQLELLG